MITENIHHHLIESLTEMITDISSILKALANRKRIEILILLLHGSQSYGIIVKELGLKKTAVSNHLFQLIEVNLVIRKGNGVYEITGDGIEFIKAIERAYHKSPTRQLKRFESLQRRKVSPSFLKRLNP